MAVPKKEQENQNKDIGVQTGKLQKLKLQLVKIVGV